MRFALLFATAVACGHPTQPPATSGGAGSATAGPAVITDEADAAARIGKRTGVKGKAGNAKLGGVIQTESQLTVYCGGVTEWPNDVNGKVVTAFGTLRHSGELEAKRGSNGEISQGTTGPVWLLDNCQYE